MFDRPHLDPSEWAADLGHEEAMRQVILHRPLMNDDGVQLFMADRSWAALGTVVGRDEASIAAAVARAAGAAAGAMVASRESVGEVVLHEPGLPARQLLLGGRGLGPIEWLQGLGMACLARDQDSAALLAANLPEPGLLGATWMPLCRAIASVVTERPTAEEDIAAARKALDQDIDRGTREVEPPWYQLVWVASSLHGWEHMGRVVQEALKEHSRLGHRRPRDRVHMLAFALAGLCAVAHDRGRPGAWVDSPYTPRFLVEGAVRGPLSRVTRSHGSAVVRRRRA